MSSFADIVTYRKAHEEGGWGAYVAEILGPNVLGQDVYVGDGQNILAAASTSGSGQRCSACHSGVHTHLLTNAKYVDSKRREKR